MVVGDPKIARLLEHPAIWRGRSAAQRSGLPTGFAALDEYLPDGGWPRTGLIEFLVSRFGSGELTLLVPVQTAPVAALVSCGVVLERVAVVGTCGTRQDARFRGDPGIWAFEQTLGSGACDAVLGWLRLVKTRDIRRLQLAAERGRTLGVLFRPRRAAREASAAVLRLSVEPLRAGVRLTILKGRSARRDALDIPWPGS